MTFVDASAGAGESGPYGSWPGAVLCHDHLGGVHIVPVADLVDRQSVYGVVARNDGVLLVQNRGFARWDFPGGGIDAGEDMLGALRRELSEETGMRLEGDPRHITSIVEYFFDHESRRGWRSRRHFYAAAASGHPLPRGNNDDVVRAGFVDLSRTPAESVAPIVGKIVELCAARAVSG